MKFMNALFQSFCLPECYWVWQGHLLPVMIRKMLILKKKMIF